MHAYGRSGQAAELTLLWIFRSAPCSTRNLTASRWPLLAECIRAVHPNYQRQTHTVRETPRHATTHHSHTDRQRTPYIHTLYTQTNTRSWLHTYTMAMHADCATINTYIVPTDRCILTHAHTWIHTRNTYISYPLTRVHTYTHTGIATKIYKNTYIEYSMYK